MEEFENKLDLTKFRSTNAIWNRLMLNAPWSVGYVTTLIELEEWRTKEDWESFYYESGAQRKKEIEKLPSDKQSVLEDFQLVRTNNSKVQNLPYSLQNINTQYGRTEEDLAEKGRVLYEVIKDNGNGLTLEECIECVRYRVICETWNGVVVREASTIKSLKTQFPQFEFRKTPGELDFEHAVDYEVYKSDILIGAIQIKPKSYLWNAPYIRIARTANKRKQTNYFESTGIRVIDIISSSKGVIENQSEVTNYFNRISFQE